MLPVVKNLLRPLFYAINDGKKVYVKGYEHLKDAQWIVDKRLGMAYYKGYYEPEICDYLLKNVKRDSTFVDVGAHAGYFSLFAVKLALEGEVFSFEPEPQNCRFIRTIKDLNKINNWKIYNDAVGRENGTLFFSNGPTSTTGKVQTSGDFKVSVVKLDEVLLDSRRVDIIKIDVEGFGGRVLEGAIEVIKKYKPKIMFEVHQGSDELDVLMNLLGNEYVLTDLDAGRIVSKDVYPHFVIAEPGDKKTGQEVHDSFKSR